MKTIVIMISMLTLFIYQGYSQNTDVKVLLNNPETREVIFNAIANDHQLMTDFMKTMKGNEHASMMMKNDNQQMGEKSEMGMMGKDASHQMMGKENMMGMMNDNPEMMMNMMSNMMDMCEKDSVMSNKMANMMTDHPEMMQMCMKKMNEKGMMGKDGKMRMMKPASSEMKKQHEHK